MGYDHRGTCLSGNGIYTFPWRGSGILDCVLDALVSSVRARDFTFITGAARFLHGFDCSVVHAPDAFAHFISNVTRFCPVWIVVVVCCSHQTVLSSGRHPAKSIIIRADFSILFREIRTYLVQVL